MHTRRLAALIAAAIMLGLPISAAQPGTAPPSKIYYVRQTVGDDTHDGLSPETAWAHITKAAGALHAGDTAYVGPGLYREEVLIQHDGESGRRISLIADATGEHTGDPPGLVMLSGGDPVDERIFSPHDKPAVYRASVPGSPVLGVAEMDGDQYRYLRVSIT